MEMTTSVDSNPYMELRDGSNNGYPFLQAPKFLETNPRLVSMLFSPHRDGIQKLGQRVRMLQLRSIAISRERGGIEAAGG